MDPISAGASVLAFVVLALDGAKGLYQLITGFKRATRETRAVAAAIQNLQHVLLQFQTSGILNRPATELNDIVDVLSACHQDLTCFQQNVKEYQLGSSASKGRKVLQNLKRSFAKPDLEFIRQKISDYHGALHLRVGIINSTTLQMCQDSIQGLRDTTAVNSLQNSTILSNVENIKTSISAHKVRLTELQDTAMAGVQQTSTLIQDVQSMKSSVENQFRNMTMPSNATIDRNAAYSAAQLDNILTAFRTLQAQFLSLPAPVAIAQDGLAVPQGLMQPCPDRVQATNEDLELNNSLERLRRLGSSGPRTLYDEEAQMIIDDLGRLLRALSEFEHAGLSLSIQNKTHADSEDGITVNEMEKLRSLVSLAGGVAVNRSPTRFTTARYQSVTQKRWWKDSVSGNQSTTIRINKRRLQWPDDRREHGQLQPYTDDEEFYATIKTIVEDTHCPYVLTAYISQVKQQCGFYSLNPIVCVGRMLPNDSPIFKTVTRGDVAGLRRILARGEGTLRDRDSRGTPLLHYATTRNSWAVKHQMCEFLIENGADVDEVAPLALNRYGTYMCTPIESILGAPPWLEDYEERLYSFRVLLAAGADPTYDALAFCMEGTSITTEKFDYLRLILDNPIPFVELEDRDINGKTALLRAAELAAVRSDGSRILNSLLSRGANIHARSLDGANCLRVLINGMATDHLLDVQKCLVLLIQAGADVHSVDQKGISIFDIVYKGCVGCSADLGDVWDSALSICGYDIRQMRKGVHRVSVYRRLSSLRGIYKREHFESLWRGREEFCPYYLDPLVWCPSSTTQSGRCPYEGMIQFCPGPERISREEPPRCHYCGSGFSRRWIRVSEEDESEEDEFEESASETMEHLKPLHLTLSTKVFHN